MLSRRAFLIFFLFALTFTSTLSWACECSNSTPIQKSAEKYRNRAVFTARIIQLMGHRYEWGDKQYSDVALAVVHERYWGLPWYWPKVVILSGQYPCDMAMAKDEEYIVAGRRMRYGIIDVALCSGTKPLKMGELDLRTLDGSNCRAPGGTLIGKLYKDSPTGWAERLPYVAETLTLRDPSGRLIHVKTDKEGIFELRHSSAGEYFIDPKLSGNKYVKRASLKLREGECLDSSMEVYPYVISGTVSGLKPPGDWPPSVELIPLSKTGQKALRVLAEPSGKFFFEKVPEGEYLLGVNLTSPPSPHAAYPPTYYPGTTLPKKAKVVTIRKDPIAGSLDFAVTRLRLERVPLTVAFADGTPAPQWYADLELAPLDKSTWTKIDETIGWSTENKSVGLGGLMGIAGRHHRVIAREKTLDGSAGRCSDPVELDARHDAKPIRLVLTHQCVENR
ncbi:MAG: hypothetical protein JWO13_62 [Acidobacteriales bacterium]|nr:hypothetical protein [Terriglobales bacterium]